jgi:hypothetical protein
LRARAGSSLSALVAHFQEPKASAGGFQATVNWGDGSAPTAGHVRIQGKGRFSVFGSHRYAAAGVFSVTVTVQDAAGRRIIAQSSAHVSR